MPWENLAEQLPRQKDSKCQGPEEGAQLECSTSSQKTRVAEEERTGQAGWRGLQGPDHTGPGSSY